MEPRHNGSEFSPREGAAPQAGAQFERPATTPETGAQSQENWAQRSPERMAAAPAEQLSQPAAAPPPNLPQPAPQADGGDPAGSPQSQIPSVAGDDDLIEREWVDHAKKILSQTKDDPYRREQEINKLQVDYIRKRYGREIGDAGS